MYQPTISVMQWQPQSPFSYLNLLFDTPISDRIRSNKFSLKISSGSLAPPYRTCVLTTAWYTSARDLSYHIYAAYRLPNLQICIFITTIPVFSCMCYDPLQIGVSLAVTLHPLCPSGYILHSSHMFVVVVADLKLLSCLLLAAKFYSLNDIDDIYGLVPQTSTSQKTPWTCLSLRLPGKWFTHFSIWLLWKSLCFGGYARLSASTAISLFPSSLRIFKASMVVGHGATVFAMSRHTVPSLQLGLIINYKQVIAQHNT